MISEAQQPLRASFRYKKLHLVATIAKKWQSFVRGTIDSCVFRDSGKGRVGRQRLCGLVAFWNHPKCSFPPLCASIFSPLTLWAAQRGVFLPCRAKAGYFLIQIKLSDRARATIVK